MHTNRLADTITQLKEKRAYYQALSEKEEKGEKTEVKDEHKPDTKKSSPKKENKPNVSNEADYPSLHWSYLLSRS